MKRITAKFFVLYVSPFLCFYIAFTHKNRKQLMEDDFEWNEEEIQIAWPRETNEQYSHTSKFFLLQRIHANTAGNKENPTMIHFNSPNVSRNKI